MREFLEFLSRQVDEIPAYFIAKQGLEGRVAQIRKWIEYENYIDADEAIQEIKNDMIRRMVT